MRRISQQTRAKTLSIPLSACAVRFVISARCLLLRAGITLRRGKVGSVKPTTAPLCVRVISVPKKKKAKKKK
jgi:hypothetical protein